MAGADDYSAVPGGQKGSSNVGCYVAGGCLSCYAILVVVCAVMINIMIATIRTDWLQPQHDAKGHLRTPANVTMYEWWPGCKRPLKDRLSVPWKKEEFDKCGKTCFDASLPMKMHDFFHKNEHEIELVSFPSRKGKSGQPTVKISAWWMPAKDPKAPIIVLVHGMSGTNIGMKALLPAYMLNVLGYSVLAPDLRDHGLSGKSANPSKESWGAEYYLDVLGAWDWAVVHKADKDAKKVGLMGNSLGGFSAATAAGLESKVQALWLDGAIYDPYSEILVDPVTSRVGPAGMFAQVLFLPGWWLAEKTMGIPLRHQLPETTIPTRKSKLQVGMVYAKEDSLVQGAKKRYTDLFANNPDAAEITSTFWPEGTCNGNAHCLSTFQYPQEYSDKLDSFWSCVFKGTKCAAAEKKETEAKKESKAKKERRLREQFV